MWHIKNSSRNLRANQSIFCIKKIALFPPVRSKSLAERKKKSFIVFSSTRAHFRLMLLPLEKVEKC
jgi:hypothetical protein